jgi:hypothetical protein
VPRRDGRTGLCRKRGELCSQIEPAFRAHLQIRCPGLRRALAGLRRGDQINAVTSASATPKRWCVILTNCSLTSASLIASTGSSELTRQSATLSVSARPSSTPTAFSVPEEVTRLAARLGTRSGERLSAPRCQIRAAARSPRSNRGREGLARLVRRPARRDQRAGQRRGAPAQALEALADEVGCRGQGHRRSREG